MPARQLVHKGAISAFVDSIDSHSVSQKGGPIGLP